MLTITAHLQCFAQGYNFVGSAFPQGENCYILTPASPWQNGSLWYDEPIDLNDDFHLQFIINFGSIDLLGADGMVFVMQQVGNNVLGQSGEGMGFSGFSPSLGIEFDSFQNTNLNDPWFDHIAILRQGNVNHNSPNNLAGPVQASSTDTNIEDGEDHIVDMFWDAQNQEIQVWFDCVERLTLDIDLIGDVFQNDPVVFWGFTGATGGEWNEQKVCMDPQILGVPDAYEVCLGDDVQLAATGASAGAYSWEPAEFLNDPTISNPVATVNETTSFTVSYTDLCLTELTQTTTVTVYDPQVDLGPDQNICQGETTTINIPADFDEILWSDGSTTPEIEVSEAGLYVVTVTEAICIASDEIEITVTPLPDLDLETEVTICEGESWEVDLSGEPYDFLWNDNSTSPVRSFTDQGIYTLTASDGDCSSTYSTELSVNLLPVFDLGNDLEICDGETASPEVLTLDNAIIAWNTGETGPLITTVESGIFWAEATADNCSYSDTIEVIVHPNPQLMVIGDESICEGSSAHIAAFGGDTYVWNTGDQSEEISVSEAGNYSVTGTISETGCFDVAVFAVSRQSLPFIRLINAIEKCQDEEIWISATANGHISWSHGQMGDMVRVSAPGTYYAEIENSCGFAIDSVRVTDKTCFYEIFIPTAFTPNADGVNDLFRAEGLRVEKFEMRIFNRWGELVFESAEISTPWNGSYMNNDFYCPSGIYAVQYVAEMHNGEILRHTGLVHLIR